MTAPEELYCVSCGTIVSGDDRFCEACGARVSMPGDDHRDHTELDLGIVAGVTDRGRVHERNEDALFVAAASGHAVAVVCDGVSTSDAPHAASQLAADVAGRALVEALARRAEPDPAPDWDGPAATAAAIDAAQQAVAGIVARTSAASSCAAGV